jgi:prevent-host-death family protein
LPPRKGLSLTSGVSWTNWTKLAIVRSVDPVSIHEAKTHLSRLIARAESGEEIVVRRGAVPVAKIVAYHAPTIPRQPGALKGRIVIADDFDEIPEEFIEYLT